MKSRLQRSSTALLVAMVGLSLVFSAGCTNKKKKSKEAIETPDKDKSADNIGGDDKHASTDTGASPDAIDSKSSSDFGSSDKPADAFASAEPKDGIAPAGGSFEGLESRHGSATVGGDQAGDLGLTPAAPAPEGDQIAEAPVHHPKKKGGKKKKKSKKADLEAPIETADAGDDAGAAAGPGGAYTVKKGDMMSKIAKAHGVSLKSLLSANKMTMDQASKLKVGTKLKIPGTGKAD